MRRTITRITPAKINLFLRVTGRRSDGYHELDSIFLPISIRDRVCLKVTEATDASVALKCNWSGVPNGEQNLAYRAARTFLDEFKISVNLAIDLEKEIPMGAGLGGGSSDAAAVLRMLAMLTNTPIDGRIAKIALGLGADVPFFLDPRPTRVQGIGERISILSAMARLSLVIAAPPLEVRTARVFGELRPDEWSGPCAKEEFDALCAGKIEPAMLVNDLAPAAMKLYPEIAALKAMLEKLGTRAVAMTGSGGAVFGIFANDETAAVAAIKLAKKAPTAFVRQAFSYAAHSG